MPNDIALIEALPPGALTTADMDLTMEFAAAEKATATRAAYESDWRHYTVWCLSRGATALPGRPGVIAA
jgi:hypothetical protein